MSEKLVQNLLEHQKELAAYLHTNIWLNSASLIVLLIAVVLLWKGYEILKRLERQGPRQP